MPTPANTRHALPSDFDQWAPLWAGYNAFYGRVGPTALGEDITLSTWNRFFDLNEPVHCLVAEQDGNLIGFAHYILHRNTIQIEPTCYLQDLYADASTRGKGIGRALLVALEAHVLTLGITSLYWHTHKTNETAMKLYDKVATNTEFVVYRKTL